MSYKILVTGGSGQLGMSIKSLLGSSATPIYRFVDKDEFDLTNHIALEDYLDEFNPNLIINTAAYTAVDLAETEIESAKRVNEDVPKALATYCRDHKKKLIHISTDYVFSGESNIPLKEDDKPFPTSIYGQTKWRGEENILNIHPSGSIILRTSWLYSPFGKNFFVTMSDLLKTQEKRRVVQDQVGSPTSALDLAKAIIEIANHAQQFFPAGLYHFANEGVASWYDFAMAIRRKLHLCGEIEPCQSNEFKQVAKRPSYSVLDKKLFRSTFRKNISHWEDALDEVIMAYKSNSSTLNSSI